VVCRWQTTARVVGRPNASTTELCAAKTSHATAATGILTCMQMQSYIVASHGLADAGCLLLNPAVHCWQLCRAKAAAGYAVWMQHVLEPA
jgi:hypothetical protein